MFRKISGPIKPTALYETDFHLPNTCSPETLQQFLTEHASLMPGLIPTGPLLKMGDSHIKNHNHYMAQYLFEDEEKARHYIQPDVSAPVREAFSKEYGAVAKERKRYLNGVPL